MLALATQLVVSFGHVHLDRGVPSPGHFSVLLGAPASGGTDAAALPASDEAPAIADDYCAICALIHLAGTAVAAEPPSLPLPAVFGRTFAESTAVNSAFSNSTTRMGWTIGAGVETRLVGNWTGKLEYLHMDFGSIATVPTIAPNDTVATSFNSRISDNIIRVGINYKFDRGDAIAVRH